jgi:hypothetical protein
MAPWDAIAPGYQVYAHHRNAHGCLDVGQYVGIMREMLEHGGVHYLHVVGGLDHGENLYLPLGAVATVLGRQIHLTLGLDDLFGRAWNQPPGTVH